VRLNFFIASNPLRFAEIEETVDLRLSPLAGNEEDE
jgi:hypothetical protein